VRRLSLVSAVALALASCAGKTAIVVEVTQAEDAEPLDRLVFSVGARLLNDAGTPPLVRDPSASVDAQISGRDLVTDPYRLYVESALDDNGPITVVVLGYRSGALIAFAVAGPQEFVPKETILIRVTLAPRANVNPLPTGCIWWIEEGQRRWIGSPDDHDCDGFRPPVDCDDENFRINPAVSERCGNGVDDNCNMQIDETEDKDDDGVATCAGDCDDNDRDIHPGATEICDGKDNDCDGRCDDGFDRDGDRVTSCGSVLLEDDTCAGGGTPDCNDDDPDVHPGATETCDGKDNDCNGTCDDGGFDADQDGFTACGTVAGLAPVAGTCGAPTSMFTDCQDGDEDVHPYAHQICDGKANRCDAMRETAEPCFVAQAPLCRVGIRSCQDVGGDAGMPGLGATCAPDIDVGFNVDPVLCDNYTQSCASNAEPWLCAVKQSAIQKFACDLSYRVVPGTATAPPTFALCSGGSVVLPVLTGATACVWTIAGGSMQEQYLVNLEGQTLPGPILTSCDGSLLIESARAPVPQPADVVLYYGDTMRVNRVVFVFTLTPKRVASCPPSALSCKMI